MFHPKHSNGSFVKELGQHDNIIVRQYSVWSIIENSTLCIDDLGIPFNQIENQPPNVQAKLLELGASQLSDSSEREHLIERGIFMESVIAREGLALGLLNKYYDGLEGVTINWFDTEKNSRVRELLAQHFGLNGNNNQRYFAKALQVFDEDPSLRKRLLLGAEGTKLFSELKALELTLGSDDLFANQVDDLTEKLRVGGDKMEKKKVLMMCASPKDANPLRLDQEARDLKEQSRLVENRKVEVDVTHAWAIRTNQVQMELLNNTPEILHFSGHGGVGVICLEGQDGNTAEVSSSAIEGLVKLHEQLECLVLNACYSDSIAQAAKPHLVAVIGCKDSIGDEAAAIFSKAFYRAISHGKSYRIAYEMALNELDLAGLGNEAKIYTFVKGGKQPHS